MVDVASLENCKRLHKVSEWDYEIKWLKDKSTGDYSTSDEWDYDFDYNQEIIVPAYDLGFLLRKLPKTIDKCPDGTLTLYFYEEEWVCGYDGGEMEMFSSSISPENAACLLTTKLFEERILKVENMRGLQ